MRVALLVIVFLAPTAAAGGYPPGYSVEPFDDASAWNGAVSGTGDAGSYLFAASVLGNATAHGYGAVSATGNAEGGTVGIAPLGDASGGIALTLLGDATGAIAFTPTGTASGATAIAVFGDAHGSTVAVSVFGRSEGEWTSLSVFGDASGWRAYSVLGHAEGEGYETSACEAAAPEACGIWQGLP